MEKLNHPITVKVTDDVARQIAGLAIFDGVDGGASEWVRHLVLVELARRKKQRDDLNAIFVTGDADGEGYLGSRGLPASKFHG